MTSKQLREWLFQNSQDDQWWISLDAVTEEFPVTVNEIEELLKSGQYGQALVLHVSHKAMAHPTWIEVALQSPHQQRTLPALSQRTVSSGTTSGAMFLYIPTARLIVMSIVSLGIYEAYWIYRNWRYIKERDGLKIQPFWRGFFGIFYIHSLLKAIKTDPATYRIAHAKFSPGGLATGWIMLRFLGNGLARVPDPAVNLIGFVISAPTFLFLLPAQNHINALNEVSSLRPAYYPFSGGHIVCLVLGIIGWLLILAGLTA